MEVHDCRCGAVPRGYRLPGLLPRYVIECPRCHVGFTSWLFRRDVIAKWNGLQFKLRGVSDRDFNRARRHASKAVKRGR